MIERIKKNAVRSVFSVKDRILLTPHYIRVIFDMSDEQVEMLRDSRAGGHNKLFIPQNGPFPAVARTYTTRRIDVENKELWVDFVAHGDNGPASYWANRATKGDTLEIAMKDGDKPLFPVADNYLFVGDSTAIPVISVMLEQIPVNATAKVIMEIYSSEDELPLLSNGKTIIRWTYHPEPENGNRLAAIVRKEALQLKDGFIFVAAEYDTVRELKSYFRDEMGLFPHEYSVVSYWKKGASEEQSSMERRQQRIA
jgi:NADPH-dependent ferric siderophore reductase